MKKPRTPLYRKVMMIGAILFIFGLSAFWFFRPDICIFLMFGGLIIFAAGFGAGMDPPSEKISPKNLPDFHPNVPMLTNTKPPRQPCPTCGK
jgi:hypothetical protein